MRLIRFAHEEYWLHATHAVLCPAWVGALAGAPYLTFISFNGAWAPIERKVVVDGSGRFVCLQRLPFLTIAHVPDPQWVRNPKEDEAMSAREAYLRIASALRHLSEKGEPDQALPGSSPRPVTSTSLPCIGTIRFFYAGTVPGSVINTRNMARQLAHFADGATGIMLSGMGSLTPVLGAADGCLGVPWQPGGPGSTAAIPNSPLVGSIRVRSFPLHQAESSRLPLVLERVVVARGAPMEDPPLFSFVPDAAAQQQADDAAVDAAAEVRVAGLLQHSAAEACLAHPTDEAVASVEAAAAAHTASIEAANEAKEIAEVVRTAASASEARSRVPPLHTQLITLRLSSP